MSTFFKGFEGYTRRSATEFEHAVRGYVVSVDTNVLLELYRFTPEARKEFLEVLRKLGDRLWVPHQVVREYFNRRVDVVKEHLELYSTVPDALSEHKKKAIEELNRFAKRCSLSVADREKLTKPIEDAFAVVTSEVGRHRQEFDLSLESMISEDHVLAALAEILDGKTGDPFSGEEEASAVDEFSRRVASKRPPGYKDADKGENAHGDYFVWEQLLRHASVKSTPVLFVTNDAKEDWVKRQSGFIVGARPELIAEFSARCHADFLLTQLGPFLRTAKEELGVAVSPSTVAQAENLQKTHEMSSYSLPEEMYRTAIMLLHEARADVKEDGHRRSIVKLINHLEGRAIRRGDRIYVPVPPEGMPDFLDAVRRAGMGVGRASDAIDSQSDVERKLERVRRRYENATGEYERSVAAIEQADLTDASPAIREVLEAAKHQAQERVRVLARRMKELESAYMDDSGTN